jgi:hypothetical protein
LASAGVRCAVHLLDDDARMSRSAVDFQHAGLCQTAGGTALRAQFGDTVAKDRGALDKPPAIE